MQFEKKVVIYVIADFVVTQRERGFFVVLVIFCNFYTAS